MKLTLDRETAQRPELRRTRVWPQFVTALVLAAVGVGLLLFAGRGTDDAALASGNRALVDTEATNQVVGEVGNALSEIFTYAPETLDETELASHDVLTGKAATDYARLFVLVRKESPAQKVAQTTRVVRAGVSELRAGTAQLLVFLDQLESRNGKVRPVKGVQLAVTAQLKGGHWLISDFKLV